MLAAREAERRSFEPALDLVPECRPAERLLDPVVEVVLHPEDAQAVGHVVVDRLRERVRSLEHHPDAPPHLDRIDPVAVEIDAVVEQAPVDLRARHQVVHPIETP